MFKKIVDIMIDQFQFIYLELYSAATVTGPLKHTYIKHLGSFKKTCWCS